MTEERSNNTPAVKTTQLETADLEGMIRDIKDELAFLGAAFYPIIRNQEMRLNEREMGGLYRILEKIQDELGEIADAEIVTSGAPVEVVPQGGLLDKVTKEQMHEVFRLIDKDLGVCLPELTVLNGFLGDDPTIDPNAELAVRDTVAATYAAVQSAIKRMDHVL